MDWHKEMGVHMTRAPRVVLTASLDRATQDSEQKVGYSKPEGPKTPPWLPVTGSTWPPLISRTLAQGRG